MPASVSSSRRPRPAAARSSRVQGRRSRLRRGLVHSHQDVDVQLAGRLGGGEVGGPRFPPEHLRSHGFNPRERLFGEGSRLCQLATFARDSGEPDERHRFGLGIFECARHRQRGLQVFVRLLELSELAVGIPEAKQCEPLAGRYLASRAMPSA